MQWAAAHWQLEICQLLLAKGADVEAYNWGGIYTPVTPLGIACSIGYYRQFALTNIEKKHATDTLGLLLESGLDTHASVEIDHNLYYLAAGITMTTLPHSVRRAVAQQFLWLMRKYIQATTYDGLLSYTEPHPKACEAIMASEVCFTYSDEFWKEQRPDSEFLTFMDTQVFQTFWLYMLAQATEYGDIISRLSLQFCRSFTGDSHYQQPWKVYGHTSEQSPMQLALSSFEALRTFYYILKVSGTDIVQFTELESTMPWCTYTQEALMGFFSLQYQRCTYFKAPSLTSSICHDCKREFQHEVSVGWEGAIELVRSGESLASSLECVSYEEEDRLYFQESYCQDCSVAMQKSWEIDGSQHNRANDSNEHMGFIESEPDDDGEPFSATCGPLGWSKSGQEKVQMPMPVMRARV
jgi:hypothetical protein